LHFFGLRSMHIIGSPVREALLATVWMMYL
jgi:hypothetical protein